jgi:hypothetical protein
MWPIGCRTPSCYDHSHKCWRSGVAIKANPSRGGDAKPRDLLLRRAGSRAVERQRRGNEAPLLERRGR